MNAAVAFYLPVVLAGLTVGAVYSLIALGLYFIYQATHLIDFSQGQFVALGGLLTASFVSTWHLGPLVSLILSGAGAALVGLVYELLVLRRVYAGHEMTAILATVAFMLLLLHTQEAVWGHSSTPVPQFTPGWHPVLLGVPVVSQYFWVWLLLLAIGLGLRVFFGRTLLGQSALAAAQDPLGAAVTGIDVVKTRTFAVVLGSAVAGMAGAAVAPITLASAELGPNLILYAFTGLIVGGIDSPVGAVVGSLLVGVFQEVMSAIFSYGYADPLTFVVLLLMLLIRPRGLFAARR
jgi:branched-chain amino acid transport system permease protein